jgi:NarL family two-component system response regulator YdfI
MTRVLIVADSGVVRAGLEAIAMASPTLTVVGSFSSIAAQQLEKFQPDVVLLVSELPEDAPFLNGSLVDTELLSPAIVLLVDELQGSSAAEALRSGVRAVLPDDATAAEIVAAVEAVAAGLVVLHPEAIGALLPALPATRPLSPAPNQALTPREIEVLRMLAEGMGNKAIARQLSISDHTVKFHVSSIFAKLNASSRTEAVTLGARQGLILL